MKKLIGFIAAAVCLSLGSTQALAATLKAAPVTKEKALAVAEKAVPAGSTYLRTQSDGAWYEVEFFSDGKQESYEVKIDKSTGKTSTFESRAVSTKGGKTATLTEEQAKKVVLDENAGATINTCVLDWDDGLREYVITFTSEKYYGEYTIHPQSGKVLERDIRVAEMSAAKISEEKAKQIVRAKIPGATITQWELDRDDGREVYEGEAVHGRIEYEFTIDARTGKILEWDKDYGD